MTRNQKCHLQRLLLVQPGIAKAGIVKRQVVLVQTFAAASALCDCFAGELEMDAAEVATFFFVDGECLLKFGENVSELSGLDAG